MLLSMMGAAYSIPGYGCGLVSGVVCVQLQWSGLILGFIVAVGNGISLVYDPMQLTVKYDTTSANLLKLARSISLELDKDDDRRDDAVGFAQRIVDSYDKIIDDVRLPWYVHGEQQLANISLLQTFSASHQHQRGGAQIPVCELTDADRHVMRQISHEMGRLGSAQTTLRSSLSLEEGVVT